MWKSEKQILGLEDMFSGEQIVLVQLEHNISSYFTPTVLFTN